MTSRMEGASVKIMASRSTPPPKPPVGGIPYSIARRKSSSIGCAFRVPARAQRGLRREPLPLVNRVIDLAERIAQFRAGHVNLEATGQRRIAGDLLRQR